MRYPAAEKAGEHPGWSNNPICRYADTGALGIPRPTFYRLVWSVS